MEGLYLFKLDKELLELGALEMDSTLEWLFDKIPERDDTVEIFNEKGISRTFAINRRENLLQGRGIKGFFGSYDDGYLFIEALPDNKFKIITNPSINSSRVKQLKVVPGAAERIEEVLNAMNGMRQDETIWFDLYHRAQDFALDTGYDKLICLPHLRDLEKYEFQIKTVKAVMKKFRGRVLLCDEVGLGKTVEAGMAMLEYIMRGLVRKIIILVPPSLVDQWYYEMKRKFNQDFIRSDDPAFKDMGDNAWLHYNKVIASISTAKRKNNSDVISGIQYDLVIVDEAHHLKNKRTVAWQFVNSLRKKYIYLLTATPVQNNLEELYNLITLLKPGQLKTYSFFKKNFIGDREGLEAKNAGHLRKLLSGVMIRNKRSDVDVRFTKRKASTTGINLSAAEQGLYNEISTFIRKRYLEESPVLSRFVLKSMQEEMGSSFWALLGTMEKIISNDKLEPDDRNVLQDFLVTAKSVVEPGAGINPKALQLLKILEEFGDKMIVFTKYRATQEYIVDFLKQRHFTVAEFHGGLRRRDKEAQIEFFKQDARVLVSTETGGEGRNLQFCNGMVNFDLPWNPMAIEQRIGRIHRVGQEKDVYVFNLAAKNTVEYYILELLDRKINMFELVVGEVDMILGDLEEAEDFSDIIMKAWVRSHESADMEKELEQIGERLIENKRQYIKIKDLDERLFGDSFESRRVGD